MWLSSRPPSENTKFIFALFIRQLMVANWPLYTEIAFKMIWGQSRCHVLGVKGHRRSNFKNQNFQILIADLDSLRKSMKRKCASFFYFLMRTQSNLAPKSPNLGKFTLPSFCDFDAEFGCVLIRKWKKEAHFLIILFCKQSKSAITIWKFWFLKFDL